MDEGHVQILIALICGFATILSLLWAILVFIRRLEKKFDFFAIEHELLVSDYCERKKIRLGDLPTRTGGLKV